MWGYYGTKFGMSKHYPKPTESKIIEPFAGAASYALEYFENDVIISDIDDVIVKIWKWLQQCSPNDLLKLPRSFKPGQTLDEINFDCIEARWLMGFLIKKMEAYPCNVPSKLVLIQRPNHISNRLKYIAGSLYKIKHWEIRNVSYEKIRNQKATWFIDAPYQKGGEKYRHGNKKIDYVKLAAYVKSRKGQVIVCENMNASWLEFIPMYKTRNIHKKSIEAIWANKKTNYHIIQGNIFH